MSPISRGVHGRRHPVGDRSRVPPGQYLTGDFTVFSAGPTPHTAPDEWSFTIGGQVKEPVSWSAKWVRGVTLTPDDEPGFSETYRYHNHGNPWLEQRYQGD
jgi:DMSO/TMAO reductase YedYZ molybdopterin-dependent catalytic subunit